MSQASQASSEALSLDQCVDRLCAPFEATCKVAAAGGPWPRVEDYLAEAPGFAREVLLKELLLLEIHYLRRTGLRAEAGQYRERFPELDGAWLAAVLEATPVPPDEPPPHPERATSERAAAGDGLAGSPRAEHSPRRGLAGGIPERLGEFRILREIGRGGMGVVYEAVQQSLGRRVALKVLPRADLLGPTHLERFQQEARTAARLHHTNIVPVYGVGAHEGVYYFAMQYIEGQSLDRVLRQVREVRKGPEAPAGDHVLAGQIAEVLVSGRCSPSVNREGALAPDPDVTLIAPAGPPRRNVSREGDGQPTPSETTAGTSEFSAPSEARYFRAVARVGVQVAEALAYAHGQGVLHRDIKPANLLLDTTGAVWVTDFGLAKAEGGEALTSPGDLIGTLRYLAPERLEGRSEPRSDVYSLGLTLYEMLTLRPAHTEGDPVAFIERARRETPPAPRQLDPRIPRDLETIVLKAMAREPGDRYATARALAEDLRNFLADRPIRARRSSALEHLWRWCRRNRAVAALAACLLVAVVALAIGSTVAYVLVGLQRDRAQAAELEKTHKLWESYVEQAHARRLTRQAGQRFDSLAILQSAIDLGRSLELTPEQILRMRNEAIACLALNDLRFERSLEPKFENSYYVAFDGRLEYYAVSDLEGTISIRSTSQDSEIARLPKPAVAPQWLRITLSRDGRYLVIGYAFPRQPPEVFRWELQDGKPTAKLRLEQAGARFAIAPDGRQVAAECTDGSIGIYDLSSGQLQNRVAQARNLEVIVFHPDGRKLGFCARGSRTLVVLDLETGKSSSYDHAAVVGSAAWRPDGRLLAVACNDQRIHVCDTATGRPQAALEGHINNGIDVAFSPGGELLASRGWDGTTRLWDAVTGREILRARGSFIAWRGDDQQLALYRDDHVELWEMAGLRECRTLYHGLTGNLKERPNGAGPACIDFGLEGRLLAAASLDGVRLWDISAPGTEIAHLPVGFTQTAVFQPGGANLLTYSESGLRLWPIKPSPKAEEIRFALGPPQIVYPLSAIRKPRASWAGDGCSLVAADWDRSRALLLHLDKPGKPVELKPHPAIDNVALSPDARWAVTRGHHSNRLIVWDSRSGKPVWQRLLTWPNAAFSPDGRLLATCGRERGVHLWDVPSWQPRLFLPTKEPGSFDMAFDPQGALLAVGEQFLGIRLIAPATGRDFATLEAPDDPQSSGIAFSPDGAQVATGTGNHTIHLWDLRLIRQELTGLGLDWDLPAYPPVQDRPRPLRIEVSLDAPLLEQRAWYWQKNHNLAQAIADLQRSLEMDPERASACNSLAWLYVTAPLALRAPEKALPLAEKAVQKARQDSNYRNTLGVVYYRLGRYLEAVGALERSFEQSKGASGAFDLFFLAMSHAHLGDRAKAQDCYQLALDWMYERQGTLSVEQSAELDAFRAEAAALLESSGKQ